MSEEKKELNRVEERLKELSKCELFLDNILIKDKTARQILVSSYNKLKRHQKEIEEKNIAINKMAKDISHQLKEIEELKAITKEYNAFNGAIDDKIIIADDRYFNNNGYFKNNYIPKQKIRDILNYLNDTELNNYEIVIAFKKMMQELLEDGDHIPRID